MLIFLETLNVFFIFTTKSSGRYRERHLSETRWFMYTGNQNYALWPVVVPIANFTSGLKYEVIVNCDGLGQCK